MKLNPLRKASETAKPFSAHPSRMVLLLSSILLPMASVQVANATTVLKNSYYAGVPLHLQNSSTTTTGGGPKPNVMFFVDDSGSMNTLTAKKLLCIRQHYEKRQYGGWWYENWYDVANNVGLTVGFSSRVRW